MEFITHLAASARPQPAGEGRLFFGRDRASHDVILILHFSVLAQTPEMRYGLTVPLTFV